MNTIGNTIVTVTSALDSLVFTGSNIATTIGALGLGSSTCSLEDGIENGSAVGVALSAATSTIAAHENNPNLFNIQEAMAYVESLSDEELARADQLLSAKGLDFEVAEELLMEEPAKVHVKTDNHI